MYEYAVEVLYLRQTTEGGAPVLLSLVSRTMYHLWVGGHHLPSRAVVACILYVEANVVFARESNGCLDMRSFCGVHNVGWIATDCASPSSC
jgi:hypothetical protein